MGNGMRIARSALAAGYFGCVSIVYPSHANAPRGTFVTFDAPAGGVDLIPNGINPAGTITGTYSLLINDIFVDFGFLRAPDGRVTTISVPGAIATSVGSVFAYFAFSSTINPGGAITGGYLDASGFHGFLRDPDGTFTTIDPPGSLFTSVLGMNAAGAITGLYSDANQVQHGFLFLPLTVLLTPDKAQFCQAEGG